MSLSKATIDTVNDTNKTKQNHISHDLLLFTTRWFGYTSNFIIRISITITIL